MASATPPHDPSEYLRPLPAVLPSADPAFDDLGYYRIPDAKRLFDALEDASIRYRFRAVPGDGYHGQPTQLLVSTDAAHREEVHRIHASLFSDGLPDYGSSFFQKQKRRTTAPDEAI